MVWLRRWWQRNSLLFRGAMVGGVSLGSVFLVGKRLYRGSVTCGPRQDVLPFKRRTQMYIAGSPEGESVTALAHTMSAPVFYLFFCYRIALFFIRVVPVMWYAVLTFVVHTCSKMLFYEKVRFFFVSMGPCYVKLGQWMATRSDFFPPELCEVLSQLFDNSSEHPWSHTQKKLCEVISRSDDESGLNILNHLSDVEMVAINSGSIAQVHRATLRCDVDGIPAGSKVALKVTHPRIRETVAADILAIRVCVKLLNALIPSVRNLNLDVSVNEFSRLIASQLDMLVEVDNLLQFSYNFRDVEGIIFPFPLASLSTADVLVETLEEGEPLQNVPLSEANRDISELGCHMFLKMLFEDNFVHSDLHPGNILLRTRKPGTERGVYRDGKPQLDREIIVLDAGLATFLSPRERDNFLSLFAAVSCGDGKLGASLMIDRLPPSARAAMTQLQREEFERDMKHIFDMVAPNTPGFRLSKVNISKVLSQIMTTVREHNVPLDGKFSSLVLTVIVGEGLGRKLVPEFNIFAEAAPYMIAYLQNNELYFLANKLKETYGTKSLLFDSVNLVRLEKRNTYLNVTLRNISHFFKRFFVCDVATQS